MLRDEGSLSGSWSVPLHACIDAFENGLAERFDVEAISQRVCSRE